MRVNHIYDRLTIQGEGAYTGRRCTFLRLYGCNLHCAWCDTPETWDTRGRIGPVYAASENSTTMRPYDVAHRLLALDTDLVIVTGGEPLLQRDELAEVARILGEHGVATHVETNGTLSPTVELLRHVDYFTVSPKLPSARAGSRAINLPVLQRFAELGWRRAGFKVVVSTLDELSEAVELYEQVGVKRQARWVMPEGREALTVAVRLEQLTEAALKLGLNVTGRAHVMLWGTERGR